MEYAFCLLNGFREKGRSLQPVVKFILIQNSHLSNPTSFVHLQQFVITRYFFSNPWKVNTDQDLK